MNSTHRRHILGIGTGALFGVSATVLALHTLALVALEYGLGTSPPPLVKPPEVIAVFVQPEVAPPAPPPPQPAPPPPPQPQPPKPRPPQPTPPKPQPAPPPKPTPTPMPVAVADPTPAPNAPVGTIADNEPTPPAPTPAAPSAPAAPPAPAGPPTVVLPSSNAAYLSNPRPVYPPISRRHGEQGKVLLRVFVGEDGLPREVQIKESSGFRRLDDAALAAVRKWKFVPGTRNGVPEPMWNLVPINFVLTE